MNGECECWYRVPSGQAAFDSGDFSPSDVEYQLVAGTISQAVAGEGSVLGTSFTYRYDGLGRRVEKAVNGVITRYVYDNEDIVLEYKSVRPEHSIESSAGSVEGQPAFTLTAHWTHGPGIDEPLRMERDLNANGMFEEGGALLPPRRWA